MALKHASVWQLQAESYRRHELHTRERAWLESNCYVDLCVEVLHAAGFEPWACLGFTLASDFEADQFTFFKPPPEDLSVLYGVSIYELNLWRPLIEHALVQLDRGAILLAEVDSFYLPDTAGTDYHHAHVKTTVGLETLDVEAKRLGYFHNAGYYTLHGADFDGVFQIEPKPPETHLPPYVELLRSMGQQKSSERELVATSIELARKHLRARPQANPIGTYAAQLGADMDWLLARDLATYHLYAFSVLRQLGANFEFAALYFDWLSRHGQTGLREAGQHFDVISQTAKAMILKLARAVNAKRAPDVGAMLEGMRVAWERGMESTVVQLGA